MAFQIGSGFHQMALVEAQIMQAALQNLSEQSKGHQPFVSKKKEARRKRQEEAQRLAELRAASPDQIEFDIPEAKPAEATSSQFDWAELEREMRAQLGLDVPPPVVAKPAPVAAKPKPKTKRPPVVAKPVLPAPPVEKSVKQAVKRQLEVLLQVLRPDGTEVPFYHCDPSISELEAEVNAAKKARGYGLRVLGVLSITNKEYTCTT